MVDPVFPALLRSSKIFFIRNDKKLTGNLIPFIFDGFGSGYGGKYLIRESRIETSSSDHFDFSFCFKRLRL